MKAGDPSTSAGFVFPHYVPLTVAIVCLVYTALSCPMYAHGMQGYSSLQSLYPC